MNSTFRRTAFAALLTASLALTGCGSDTKTVKLDDGSTVKVTGDGKGATIEGKDGTKITTGQGLPDGFPTADIPLIDAKVVGGSKGAGKFAYTVLLQATGKTADVVADITGKLTGAGFATGEGMDMGSVTTRMFTSDKYKVSITAAQGNDGVVVTYTVATV